MSKFILIFSVFFISNLFATQTTASQIFEKKCAMCHNLYGPGTYEEKNAMVAPPITLAMKSVTVGVDAIEEPNTQEELKTLTIAFLKDYILNPHEDKAFCEESVFKRFNTMPSLKGFITNEELDKVLPYVYEQFSPKQR